jgi:hypothetical protein
MHVLFELLRSVCPFSKRNMNLCKFEKASAILIAGFMALASSAPGLAVELRSETVRYNPAVLDDFCTLSSIDGALGGSQDRTTITSDPSETPAPSFAVGYPAQVTAASNLAGVGTLIAQLPTLTGGSASDTAELAFTGEVYATTSQIPLALDGSASSDLNVKFTSPRFDSGTYRATAVVTCNS